jgi:hypothetical protein
MKCRIPSSFFNLNLYDLDPSVDQGLLFPIKQVSSVFLRVFCGEDLVSDHPISRSPDHPKAARRKIGVPDEPAVGLAGWKFAAPQPVIVSERRSRESNDLNRRSPLTSTPPPSLN